MKPPPSTPSNIKELLGLDIKISDDFLGVLPLILWFAIDILCLFHNLTPLLIKGSKDIG